MNPIYKLAGGVWFIGMVLFAISVIRTAYFPKWSGVIILIGTLVFTATHLLAWPIILVNVNNLFFSATVIYISFKSLHSNEIES